VPKSRVPQGVRGQCRQQKLADGGSGERNSKKCQKLCKILQIPQFESLLPCRYEKSCGRPPVTHSVTLILTLEESVSISFKTKKKSFQVKLDSQKVSVKRLNTRLERLKTKPWWQLARLKKNGSKESKPFFGFLFLTF
jgi:hypothetical protein